MQRLTIAVTGILLLFSCVSGDFTIEFELDDDLARNIQPYIYEETIEEMVKNLTERLSKKDPALIPRVYYKIETDIATAELEATDILLRGFSNFKLTDIKISPIPPKGRFSVHFEEVQLISSYYKLDALAVFIPFYGSGTLNLKATAIELGGSARVSLGTSGITGVKNLKVAFGLKESNLRITGLLHNEPMSDIVSTATTECFPEFVNTYGERLGELVGQQLETLINGWLKPEPTQVGNGISFNVTDTLQIGPHAVKYSIEV